MNIPAPREQPFQGGDLKITLEYLSAGARRCLRLFQWYWAKFGGDGCYPSVSFIARKLSVSATSVKRWTGELARVGAIRKQRRGPRSNRYHTGKPVEAMQTQLLPDSDGPSFGPSFDSVSISESSELKTVQGTSEDEKQSQNPSAEFEAVQRTIEAFNVAGCGVRLIDRLFAIGKYYAVNGFRIAAELARVLGEVERRPSMAPRSAGWFTAVLESKLKRAAVRSEVERKAFAKAQASVPVRSQEDEYCPEFTAGLLDSLMGRTG